MNEIRDILIIPMIFFLVCVIILSFFVWSEFTGKLKNKRFKAMSDMFEKSRPGVLKKLNITITLTLTFLLIFIFVPLIRDFVFPQTFTVTGRVVGIETRRPFMYSEIYLDNGKTYTFWLNTIRIENGREYEVFYTPHSKTIIRVVEI